MQPLPVPAPHWGRRRRDERWGGLDPSPTRSATDPAGPPGRARHPAAGPRSPGRRTASCPAGCEPRSNAPFVRTAPEREGWGWPASEEGQRRLTTGVRRADDCRLSNGARGPYEGAASTCHDRRTVGARGRREGLVPVRRWASCRVLTGDPGYAGVPGSKFRIAKSWSVRVRPSFTPSRRKRRTVSPATATASSTRFRARG